MSKTKRKGNKNCKATLRWSNSDAGEKRRNCERVDKCKKCFEKATNDAVFDDDDDDDKVRRTREVPAKKMQNGKKEKMKTTSVTDKRGDRQKLTKREAFLKKTKKNVKTDRASGSELTSERLGCE